MKKYCYWTVVDGDYSLMMQSVVDSARAVGEFSDFHIWTDRPIDGARCYPLKDLDKTLYLFKIRFLQEFASKLKCEYLVWLDADSHFVRHPGDILRVLQGAPVHASLESDATDPSNRRPDWWGCSLRNYVQLMRFLGVRSRSVFNVNAGFWIVHHDVIETFCRLMFEFWEFCKKAGYEFTEEAPLAYATHMLCGNPYVHTLRATSDLWASDWVGEYADRLPDGKRWKFVDYFSFKTFRVNPAIVHAMRSKAVLAQRGLARQTVAAASASLARVPRAVQRPQRAAL